MARYNKKHGLSTSKTYKAWADMKDRCSNPVTNEYKYYGAIGVKVCTRWLESFENFLEDMGEAPEGTALSRKGDKGDYTKENCAWVPRSVNSSEALRGEKNVKAKLTEEQVLCIRALAVGASAKHYRAPLIAAELGTSRQTINNILQRRTWTHI